MTDALASGLRDLLLSEFTENELAGLCSDIGIDYAGLPGTGAFGKSRSMVAVARDRNKLYTLMARVREARPEAFAASGLSDLIARTPATQLSGAESPSTVSRSAFARFSRVIALVGAGLFVCLVLGSIPILFQAAGSAGGGIPTATPQPTGEAAVPTAAPASPTIAPLPTRAPASGALPTATRPAPTATAQAASSAQGPGPSPTRAEPGVEATPLPAAQAVLTVNRQIVDYLAGRANADGLKQNWAPSALAAVDAFYRRLPPILGLSFPPRPGTILAEVTYLERPKVETETGDRAVVSTRELWRYTNTDAGRFACETRDYTYTFQKEGDAFRVTDFKGDLVKTGCTPP